MACLAEQGVGLIVSQQSVRSPLKNHSEVPDPDIFEVLDADLSDVLDPGLSKVLDPVLSELLDHDLPEVLDPDPVAGVVLQDVPCLRADR